MSVRLDTSELNKFARKIEALSRETGDAMVSGMRVVAERGLTTMKASTSGKGVPVDEGTLRASGRVEGPSGIRGIVRITFGGAAAPYALYQHERTDLAHTVGEARWLIRWLERWTASGGPIEALRENARQGIEAARATL